MSTGRTWQTESTSLSSTLKLAARIGKKLRGGEVIELVGDLGCGKTAFVRGLAAGMGSEDPVRSPSFTLCKQYKGNELTLYHFDFYRLDDPGIMKHELEEILEDAQAVKAVEWGSAVSEVLPKKHITVNITPKNEEGRAFSFEYPTDYEYLFPTNT